MSSASSPPGFDNIPLAPPDFYDMPLVPPGFFDIPPVPPTPLDQDKLTAQYAFMKLKNRAQALYPTRNWFVIVGERENRQKEIGVFALMGHNAKNYKGEAAYGDWIVFAKVRNPSYSRAVADLTEKFFFNRDEAPEQSAFDTFVQATFDTLQAESDVGPQ